MSKRQTKTFLTNTSLALLNFTGDQIIAEIIKLNSNIKKNPELDQFIQGFKENTKQILFLLQKDDGSIAVGCNITDRRDLVYNLYQLQEVIRMIINGESQYA